MTLSFNYYHFFYIFCPFSADSGPPLPSVLLPSVFHWDTTNRIFVSPTKNDQVACSHFLWTIYQLTWPSPLKSRYGSRVGMAWARRASYSGNRCELQVSQLQTHGQSDWSNLSASLIIVSLSISVPDQSITIQLSPYFALSPPMIFSALFCWFRSLFHIDLLSPSTVKPSFSSDQKDLLPTSKCPSRERTLPAIPYTISSSKSMWPGIGALPQCWPVLQICDNFFCKPTKCSTVPRSAVSTMELILVQNLLYHNTVSWFAFTVNIRALPLTSVGQLYKGPLQFQLLVSLWPIRLVNFLWHFPLLGPQWVSDIQQNQSRKFRRVEWSSTVGGRWCASKPKGQSRICVGILRLA